jgi:hypothetical protein
MASIVAPVAAQTPAGWKVHIDKSTNAQDPDDKSGVKFMAMGKGFHVAGGPAGTYWNPANTATGNYTIKGTFTLVKPSNHTNYYGLVFGGNALDGPSQTYTYFLVAQNGRSSSATASRRATFRPRRRTPPSRRRTTRASRSTRLKYASPATRSPTSSTAPSSTPHRRAQRRRTALPGSA